MKEGIHIALAPHILFEVAGFPITSSMVAAWVTIIVLVAAAFFIGRNMKLVPGKVQAAVEGVFGFFLAYMEEVLEDKVLARRYFPLVMTIFLYILCTNLFGLLPIIGSVGITKMVHGVPEFIPYVYPSNTDLNMTLALAVVAFIVIEFAGIAALGFFKYFSKFVNFKSPIGFVVGLIELVSEVARLVTFSFRLFGNIFAGKVLILVALFFLPYLLPVPLMAYEVFVAFIQAAVFALLTLFFIKIAVTDHAEDHH